MYKIHTLFWPIQVLRLLEADLLTDMKQAAEMCTTDKKLGFDLIKAKLITARVVIGSIH